MREVTFKGSHSKARFQESVSRSVARPKMRPVPSYESEAAAAADLERVVDAPVLLTPFELGLEQRLKEERAVIRRREQVDEEHDAIAAIGVGSEVMAGMLLLEQQSNGNGGSRAQHKSKSRTSNGHHGIPPRSSSRSGRHSRNKGAAFDGRNSSGLPLATPVAAAVRELTAAADAEAATRAPASPATPQMNGSLSSTINGWLNSTSTPAVGTGAGAGTMSTGSTSTKEYPWGAVNMKKLVDGMIQTNVTRTPQTITPPRWRLGFKR
jgi:hypothetical protein